MKLTQKTLIIAAKPTPNIPPAYREIMQRLNDLKNDPANRYTVDNGGWTQELPVFSWAWGDQRPDGPKDYSTNILTLTAKTHPPENYRRAKEVLAPLVQELVQEYGAKVTENPPYYSPLSKKVNNPRSKHYEKGLYRLDFPWPAEKPRETHKSDHPYL
jgi:hypothetical protein